MLLPFCPHTTLHTAPRLSVVTRLSTASHLSCCSSLSHSTPLTTHRRMHHSAARLFHRIRVVACQYRCRVLFISASVLPSCRRPMSHSTTLPSSTGRVCPPVIDLSADDEDAAAAGAESVSLEWTTQPDEPDVLADERLAQALQQREYELATTRRANKRQRTELTDNERHTRADVADSHTFSTHLPSSTSIAASSSAILQQRW